MRSRPGRSARPPFTTSRSRASGPGSSSGRPRAAGGRTGSGRARDNGRRSSTKCGALAERGRPGEEPDYEVAGPSRTRVSRRSSFFLRSPRIRLELPLPRRVPTLDYSRSRRMKGSVGGPQSGRRASHAASAPDGTDDSCAPRALSRSPPLERCRSRQTRRSSCRAVRK
jgi:hypothetical protein